jgi:predicted Zn finger-like uncharacterized protein
MKFVCERCHTKYSIADDKVRQKILKIRCKTCENVITIRDAVVVNEPRAASEPRGVRAVPPAPPPRAARVVEWHVAIEGRQEGPLPLQALVSRISAAPRGSEIYVWNEHLDGWKEPKSVPEIAAELRGRTVPPPPPPLPPVPSKRLPSPPGGRPGVFSSLGSASQRRSGTHGTVDAGVKPMAVTAHAGGFGESEAERTQIQPPDAALLMDSGGPAAAAALAPRPADLPTDLHPRRSGVHPSLSGSALPAVHANALAKTNGSSLSAGASSSGLEALDFVPGPLATGAVPPMGMNALAPPVGAVASSVMGASTSTLLAQVGGRAAKARHPAFKFVVTGGLLVGLVIVVAVLAMSDRDRAGGVGKPALAEATPVAAAPEAEARARAEAEKYFKSMVGEKPAPPQQPAPAATRSIGPPPRRPAQRSRNNPEVALAPPPLAPPPLAAGGQPAPDTTAVSRRFAQDERKVASPNTRSGRRGEASFDHQKFMGVFKQQDHHTAIKSCYERALKRDERLKLARLDISVNVGETGSVKKVRVDAPPEFNGVSSCIREAVRRWRFPANSEEYEASFPLILHGNAD